MKAKISLVALMPFLPACAPQYAPRANPSSSNPTPNSFKTDAIECERQAVLAGAGGKSAAFDSCMRARLHAEPMIDTSTRQFPAVVTYDLGDGGKRNRTIDRHSQILSPYRVNNIAELATVHQALPNSLASRRSMIIL